MLTARRSCHQSFRLHETTSSTRRVVVARAKCSTCGAENVENGCDGEGRVIGGLGAVPGFSWWPIKAYRPCDKLNEAGMQYSRKGQILNDVMFGGGSLDTKANKTLEEIKKTESRGIKVDRVDQK